MKHRKTRNELEFIRSQARDIFSPLRQTWTDVGQWVLPHRVRWMLSQRPGERRNHHIVDTTHLLALRSNVAGFLEGNTSATRPWVRFATEDDTLDLPQTSISWLQKFTNKVLRVLSNSSNFYDAVADFYFDYFTFNTGSYYIEELQQEGRLFFHVLMPGSYYVINGKFNEAAILVREFTLPVKALVETYGRKINGGWDWSNFSDSTRIMYEKSQYKELVDVVHVILENDSFDEEEPQILMNRQWHSYTYELGRDANSQVDGAVTFASSGGNDPKLGNTFLNVSASRRKPFIVGKSTMGNFEYGEKGPSTDSLGLIKSLNKKAIGKDQALEQMLRPALQGPARLRKSYVSSTPNTFVPTDANSASQKGLRTIFEINPAIGSLIQDVSDLRQQVDKHYFADFLLFLSSNPKTRTATEAAAIVKEQQLVIGPNLQSLNWSHNIPLIEFVADYVLFEDKTIGPPPPELAGKFLAPDFISIFAQAQKAADLPSIDQYMQAMAVVAQINPRAIDKVNTDVYADIVADRLYIPTGLNRDLLKLPVVSLHRLNHLQKSIHIELELLWLS